MLNNHLTRLKNEKIDVLGELLAKIIETDAKDASINSNYEIYADLRTISGLDLQVALLLLKW